MAVICDSTAGLATVPVLAWNTICSVSPDWPGTACWRRLAAAALGVPDSVVLWA
jgi:hypothetical protein